ncbi:MAG: twin-arginine translocase subunit TatC [Selenomonadaceae bacterium]|nr:twin-arginine translocase subunit TatC [Selenomonadaceae bacterium]
MTEPEKKSAPIDEQKISEDETDDGTMSLTAHLEELRSRIIKALLAIAFGSVVAYLFLDEITNYLTLPVGKLYYMKPGEAFFTYLKIDIAAGFLIALPIIFYHAWKFFLPALTKSERTVLGVLVPSSVILFFVGLAFSFFLILPVALKFFMGFGEETENLQSMFSFASYFEFVILFVLPFGFVFELPLVIIVLGKLGILTSEKLGHYRRYVLFFSFVIGALVTSPDVITQIAVAIPVCLLYEVGYLVVKYILRR